MKTERRHELETNTLAKGLNDWGDTLRPYASALLAIIAVLLLVYIGASIWNSRQEAREKEAWNEFQMAMFDADGELNSLQRVASNESHDGTTMQEWAHVAWADRQLRQAAFMYLSDREGAKSRLTTIAQFYEQYADHALDSEVKNRSRLGLARLYEMQGRLEDAEKEYAKVEGALSNIAEERITSLKTKKAQDAIKWLATADLPKPAIPSGPGTPGERPGFEAGTPQPDADPKAPAASLEDLIGGMKDEEDARYPAGEAKSATESATPTEPAAETTPAGTASTESPAAETPASVETPETSEAPAEPPAGAPTAETEDAAPPKGAPAEQ